MAILERGCIWRCLSILIDSLSGGVALAARLVRRRRASNPILPTRKWKPYGGVEEWLSHQAGEGSRLFLCQCEGKAKQFEHLQLMS